MSRSEKIEKQQNDLRLAKSLSSQANAFLINKAILVWEDAGGISNEIVIKNQEMIQQFANLLKNELSVTLVDLLEEDLKL